MDSTPNQMEAGGAGLDSAVRHQTYGAFQSDEADALLPSTPTNRSDSGRSRSSDGGRWRRPPSVGTYRLSTGRRVLLGGMVAAAMVGKVNIQGEMQAFMK